MYKISKHFSTHCPSYITLVNLFGNLLQIIYIINPNCFQMEWPKNAEIPISHYSQLIFTAGLKGIFLYLHILVHGGPTTLLTFCIDKSTEIRKVIPSRRFTTIHAAETNHYIYFSEASRRNTISICTTVYTQHTPLYPRLLPTYVILSSPHIIENPYKKITPRSTVH